MNLSVARKLVIAPLAFALLAIVACGGSDPEPTATPVPPTPTPEASMQPITASPDDNPLAFLAALPEAERTCVSEQIGGQLESLLSGAETSSAMFSTAFECLSNDTIQRILTGLVIGDSGVTLSDATLTCIDERLSGVDFQQLGQTLIAGGDDASTGEALNNGLAVLPALFCLDDDERAAIGGLSESALGFTIDGASIDALECGFDAAGPAGLATLVTVVDESDTPSAEVLEVVGKVLTECAGLFAETGLLDSGGLSDLEGSLPEGIELPPELEGLLGDGGIPEIPDVIGDISVEDAVGISAEVMSCLDSNLSDEQMAQFEAMVSSGEPPTAAIILAAAECGEGAMAEAGVELPFSAENLRCMINEIGEEKVDALLRGEVGFDLSLIGAISTCGLDLSSFGN